MIELPEQFKTRMANLLGERFGEFLASYELKPCKAIRVNTLKISVDEFKKLSPLQLVEQVPWEENGFYVDEEKAGKTVAHAAGLYYVQEPSAMCAAPLLDVKGGEKVLDLCSAPGGKGTRLAQKMNGEGIIVLNEINFSRAKILSRNVERLGIKNAIVTCAPPEAVASAFAGYFDKIIVDAPCSGEGMFKKEEQAVKEWSVANVTACAARQKLILDCADKALKKGGLMVYSTCTFAKEEDEEQIERFLSGHENYKLIKSEKLYPHEVKGEGHFAALMKKTDGENNEVQPFNAVFKDAKLLKLFREFEQTCLKTQPFCNLHLVGDTLYSVPGGCPAVNLQVLRLGLRLGVFKNGRFEPDHSLAMSLKNTQANCIEVNEQTALSYLGGNTFECSENLSGWHLVTHLNYPLGWCKAVNGTAKNHLPKGIRI